MSRPKLALQGLLIPALLICVIIAMTTPSNAAVTVKVAAAGSSAMWQNMALAAYNSGNCVSGGVAPCSHYTGKAFLLRDCRGAKAYPCVQTTNVADETGNIWIVWDNGGANANVWLYVNVDSVVGDRCYFGQPRCQVMPPAAGFPAPANLITLAGAIWGGSAADKTPPAAVQAAVTHAVTAGMTDIRPEDAFYAYCRANASLTADPEAKGLGYNSANNEGLAPSGYIYCPKNGSANANLVGSQVKSAFSTSFAQVVAFSISGVDPFSGNTIPTPTVVSVGASPIVFLIRRNGALKTLLHATDTQLQCVYTDHNSTSKPLQNASCFGLTAASIDVFQREPLSGTMNTTEFSVFRNDGFQTQYSQENDTPNNPLSQTVACAGGGTAGRFRVIGTGQMVSQILTSTSPASNSCDALGYAFFSFGNVSSIANNASYGYLTLDGLDPIGPGDLLPGNNELPGSPFPAAAGCTGNTFPCDEAHLWAGGGGLSFPALRAAGTLSGPPYSPKDYRAWSVLRLVSDGTNLTSAKTLVSGAQTAAVCSVPDFVPAVAVSVTCASGTKITDPGLKLYRSHYKLQYFNGANNVVNPNNGFVGAEAGRDEGGCVLAKPAAGNAGTLNLGQDFFPSSPANNCSAPVFP